MNSTEHTNTDGRERERERERERKFVVLASAVWMTDAPRSTKEEILLSFPKVKRRLQSLDQSDWWPHDQTLDQHTWSAFDRQRGRSLTLRGRHHGSRLVSKHLHGRLSFEWSAFPKTDNLHNALQQQQQQQPDRLTNVSIVLSYVEH